MLYIDQYRAAVPFDPLDMTGLEIWLRASRIDPGAGSTIDAFINDGTLGGEFDFVLATDPADVGPTVNGEDTATITGSSNYQSTTVGRWLTDDVYDIYIVVKGAAQVNKALLTQHNNTAAVGRIVWGTANDGTGAKASIFFNNGSSHSGLSTATPFDDSWHVVRWHSTGGGDHYIQVDGGTDELVITGQQVTPLNTPLKLFCIESGGISAFTGGFAELLGCDAVQSAPVAAAANAYLMDKYGI